MVVELSAESWLVEVRGRCAKANAAMMSKSANAHVDRSFLCIIKLHRSSEADVESKTLVASKLLPDEIDLVAASFRQLVVRERISGSSEHSFDEGINESFLHVSEDRRGLGLVTGERMIVQ